MSCLKTPRTRAGRDPALNQKLSRRQTLRGGLAATLLAALGWGQSSALTQGTRKGCMVTFEATVRQGPSTGLALRGLLAGRLMPSGRIEEGAVVLPDGTRLHLVGQVNGLAINLLIRLGVGRNLYGVGTLENELHLCTGTMGGVFSGPQAGDIGDWGATQSAQLGLPPKLVLNIETEQGQSGGGR
jgi:hypothetical protein